MSKAEFVQKNETIIVYTYRYIMKTKDGRLIVQYLTEPQEKHALFQKQICENPSIVSALREYVSEVNFEYLGFTEPVKKEVKEEDKEKKEDEEIS